MSRQPRLCADCGRAIIEHLPAPGCPACLFALALPDAPAASAQFGGYQLLEPLGRGAMGIVYRARQIALQRTVALKMIRAGQFASPGEVARFEAEARAAGRLQHPNTVRVHEVGEHEGRHYFSMDLVEGHSLAQLSRASPLPPDRAARYVRGVAEAMQHAHEAGILHRDLKPSNVLVDGSDTPRVTDFGLAKQVELDAGLTATGEVLGTPSYMAPEQALGQPSDARSDVYSMGAILYELLTGRPPFRAETAVETLRQVVDDEPLPPRALAPRTPRALETICLKCLFKDPRRRYSSARALSDDLARFLAGEPILGRRPGPSGRLLQALRRRPRVAVAAGAACILATLLVLGALSLRRDQLGHNLYSAQLLAPLVLQRFERWGAQLTLAAHAPELLPALEARDAAALHPLLARQRAEDAGFESVLILDPEGKVVARDPPLPDLIGRSFDRRDYFRGALRQSAADGPAAVHISRVFPSQFDGMLKFAVSVPIRDRSAKGEPVRGVLTATVATNSQLGLAFIHDGDRKAVLVGRWDASRQQGDSEPFADLPRRVIVLHPAFIRGELPLATDSRVLDTFEPQADLPELTLSNRPGAVEATYLDPMRRRHRAWAGPWLAGMAPVGNTEYVVIVQTRDWVGPGLGALVLGGVAFVIVAWRRRRTPGEA